MLDVAEKLVAASWLLLGQMGPYLILGFLVAGVLSVCISPAWVERHLGGRGFMPVVKAALFGVPLPLCSCGVIPVGASIRRHGASRAATTSFLLSTPQTGVDSILVTYALLGPVMAIFRPVAALLTGLFGGAAVQLLGESDRPDDAEPSVEPVCTDTCCDSEAKGNAVVRALRYGLLTLPRDIGVALLVGVVIAGAIAAFVPEDFLAGYFASGIVAILLMIVVGIPLYVCATASVPIAAEFIVAGASPGAALAFLIAGPATNAATFTTVWKLLGRRTALLFIATVAGSAIASGLLLDWLITELVPQLAASCHGSHPTGWSIHLWAIVLLAVIGFSYFDAFRHKGHQTPESEPPPGRSRIRLRVTGMTCSHCAESLRRALAECEGVDTAEVDLSAGLATVTGTRPEVDQLVAAVEQLGYKASVATDDLPTAGDTS